MLAHRWYEDLFNARTLEALDEIVTSDCVLHAPGGETLVGSDAIRTMFRWYYNTIEDSRWTIHDTIISGDRAVVRASGTGRYMGGWHDIPGSGQEIAESGITIFRVAADRIAEIWFEVSDLDLARQLGAFPPA